MNLTNRLAEDISEELCDNITLNTCFDKLNNILKEMGLNDEQVNFLDTLINEVYNNAYYNGECDQADFYREIND